MVTEKQLAANRANALMSTGPTTPEGKAVASRNALMHGLTATRAAVLPSEDGDMFQGLRDQVHRDLEPVGVVEFQLVDRIAAAFWRLRRVEAIEAGILGSGLADEVASIAEEQAFSEERRLSRLRNPGERKEYPFEEWWPAAGLSEETNELCRRRERALAFQTQPIAALGRAFQRDAADADSFDRLGRYERSIQTGLHKALQTLTDLQEKRKRKERDAGSGSVSDAGGGSP